MVADGESGNSIRYFSCRRYVKEFLIKSAEILAVILGVEVQVIPFHDAKLDKDKQTTFGYRLLHSLSILGNSSTIEIPDITGMLG
jgi:hypothetical protein